MPSRWDYLYGLKKVPIVEQLVEEVSRLVARDLGSWPLAIEEWASPRDEERFRAVTRPGAPRPDDAVFRHGLRLARLELLREDDAIDDFMRNDRWRSDFPPGEAFDAMVLVSRYLVEQMLALSEATQGRLKRRELVQILERAERALFGQGLIVAP